MRIRVVRQMKHPRMLVFEDVRTHVAGVVDKLLQRAKGRYAVRQVQSENGVIPDPGRVGDTALISVRADDDVCV